MRPSSTHLRDVLLLVSAQEDMALAKYLKEKHGFVIHEMEGDGNCFFRAIAHQVRDVLTPHQLVSRVNSPLSFFFLSFRSTGMLRCTI